MPRKSCAACSSFCFVSSGRVNRVDRKKRLIGKQRQSVHPCHGDKMKRNKERMVRVGVDSKKGSRHVRYDDIPTDTFTPRTYQVELLESALHGNTIACLGSESSKVFLGLMVVKEMAHQVRSSLEEGGKRSIYLVDSEEEVEPLWTTLFHHTDLAVGRVPSEEADAWSAERWSDIFASHNLLVLSAVVFLHCLDNRYLPLTSVNLLVMDDCHKAVEHHAYVSIMRHVVQCKDSAPHLLCLTAAILGSECSDPTELANRISSLETTLHSKAETSMLVISERFGCRPKENMIECMMDDDVTGMGEQLANILHDAWAVLEDCNVKLEDQPSKTDPLHVPKFAISECINILQTLGSWCAASIAENLISQLEKIVKHESHSTLKLLYRYTITQLRLVVRVFEIGFTPDYVVDELLRYTTPKVRELINILRNYKPEMDFMIITREGDEEEAMSDFSDDDGNDDDSFDLSSSDDEEGKGKCKHIHIAVKKKEKGDGDNLFEEEKKLSGLVFVDNRYVAFALNKMMEEVCSWDENLCFVKSSHITGQGIHRSDGRKDLSNASRKQEEILRKFRMQERNLLISTSVLEEGVDIPKCNLVVRFDPPRDYRSYALSKGRARARDAEYVILVDEEVTEDFSDEIQVFKGIEQVLIGAGRGQQDLVDAQKVQEFGQVEFTPLPAFCPLNQPGAATVTMKNSISLINRYCAKLPSDAFTHLTPQCRVLPSPCDSAKFVAYLRLPVNSPIKEELMGAEMPTRQLAKMAVALQMCILLYNAGELDGQLQPVGKEMFVCEEEEEWEEDEDESMGHARPGTTKRKQYYAKKSADAFVSSHPKDKKESFLYYISMTLTGPITEEQNTRGRKIYAPENSQQSFGILLSSEIPHVPSFPVYTRSGEVTVSLELLSKFYYSQDQIDKLTGFHHFVFSSVLHLEKDPMVFSPLDADIGMLMVPLNNSTGVAAILDTEDIGGMDFFDIRAWNQILTMMLSVGRVYLTTSMGKLDIEWSFVEEVNTKTVVQKCNVFDGNRDMFMFEHKQFEDAVVMPSYRNMDQPQHFYVAEIRSDLSPLSPFPSPELYKTFAAYYTTKYGLTLTNMDQPLLDVDHTSARLNLLTPRYMNQKGRALPTSSLETKRARRENLQQKQILVPELCDIHIFSASLWRKTVCLPAILYRLNYLLLAEELRKLIATETGIGKVDLDQEFRFPCLDFGFETNPEKLLLASLKESEGETESKAETEASKEIGNNVRSENVKGNDSHDETMQKELGQREQVTAKGENEKGHHSAEDDKTDTGASSDSDSGVVLSECEVHSNANGYATAHTPVHTTNDYSETVAYNSSAHPNDKPDKAIKQTSIKPTTSTNLNHVKTASDELSASGKSEKTHNDDIADAFVTPSTSRPQSPANSESDQSVYEDASEFLTPSAPTVCSQHIQSHSPQCNESNKPNHPLVQSVRSSPLSPDVSEHNCEKLYPTLKPCSEHQLSSVAGLSSSVLPQSLGPKEPSFGLELSDGVRVRPQLQCKTECSKSSCCLPLSLAKSTDSSSCSHQVPNHSCIASHTHALNPSGEHIQCAMSCDLSQTHFTDCSFMGSSGEISGQSESNIYKSQPEVQQKQSHDKDSLSVCESPSDQDDVTVTDNQKHLAEKHQDTSQCVVEDCDQKDSSLNECDVEDCDDFLDVSGCNNTKTAAHKYQTITFPGDVMASDCPKDKDDVKVTFESINSLHDIHLDANWARTSSTMSVKEWAPDEHLSTFEVNNSMSDRAETGNKIDISMFSESSQQGTFPCEEPPSTVHTTSSIQSDCLHTGNEPEKEKGKTVASTLNHADHLSCHQFKSDINPCSDTSQSDNESPVPCPSSEEKTASIGTFVQTDVTSSQVSKDKVTNDTDNDTQEILGWGDEDARHSSEWPSLYEDVLSKSLKPSDISSEEYLTSVSTSVRESQVSVKDLSFSACNKDDLDLSETNFLQTYFDQHTGANSEEGAKLKNTVEQPLSSHSPDTNVVAEVKCDSDCSIQALRQNTCMEDHGKSTDKLVGSKAKEQFDIGLWNEKQKSETKEDVEEEKVESRPLTISLDEDTDLETFMGPSPCLLLQALTMSNANDFFSLERLETIGDSFLKYAITVYLYCCYPGTHEGKLSYLRSKQVSNYNLYRLGRRKGLAERMVSTKFEPYENWLPPGYVISEDRRRGPVPKVVITTSNPRLSAAAPVNFLLEKEDAESDEDQRKETEAFQKELEEIDLQQAVDQQNDISSSCHKQAMIPYCLQLHHGIPDKSVADCVEALIGCYLTTCGKQAALTFMSWLGLKVLPQKQVVKQNSDEEDVTVTVFQELQCPPSPLLTSVPHAPQLLSRLLEGFEEFEAKIQYKFKDRSYLLQAFTHASYHYNYITDCYQRLEFLGDAILDYVITRHLYEDSRRYSPGILTDLRSALVNNNIFAALAVKWDFHKFFKAISPSLFIVIDKFVLRQKERMDEIDEIEEVKKIPKKLETDDEEDGDGEGREATVGGMDMEEKEEEVELEIPKALGDIFESVAGAIYLDSGMSLDSVWTVYFRMMKPHIDKYLKDIPKSPVRELLEMEPETAKFEKPERTLEGKIRVTVNVVGKGVFYGVGRNYRIAKSAAAKKALRFIRNLQMEGQV